MPTPLVPAQKPIARCRSAGSLNMFVMIDSVDGMISAPPMPMLARAAISMLTEPENAAQAEPAANAARPARSGRRGGGKRSCSSGHNFIALRAGDAKEGPRSQPSLASASICASDRGRS